MKQSLLVTLMSLIVACQSASAEIITFDFEGTAGTDLDDLSTGSTSATTGSVTLTLTATASSGTFNLTTTNGFGINAAPSGDETDAFDGAAALEQMQFSIASNVSLSDLTLVSIEFDRFTTAGNDSGSISNGSSFLGGFPLGIFNDSDLSGSNVLTLETPGIVSSDQLVLAHVQGAWGLESITFRATTVSVPEPRTFSLFFAAGLLITCTGFMRRKNGRNVSAQ